MREYPPAPGYAYAAHTITAVGATGAATVAFGDRFLPHPWNEVLMQRVGERRAPLSIMIFMLARSAATSLTATHALEVSVGEWLVFSKLQTGRFPTEDELVTLVRHALDQKGSTYDA